MAAGAAQVVPVGKADALLAAPAHAGAARRAQPEAGKAADVVLAVSDGVDARPRVHTMHIKVIRI